jgi:chemotaxis protein CheC
LKHEEAKTMNAQRAIIVSENSIEGIDQNNRSLTVACWTTENLTDLEKLLQIGTIGAERAAAALCKLLHEAIVVEVPRLHTVPPHVVPRIYNLHDRPITGIYMELKGELGCDIMLAFNIEEAQDIAALMTGSGATVESDRELKRSATEELGSIMICSFLSAIANFVGLEMIPTPPQMKTDSFDAILDSLLAKQALASDFALIFDTRFKRSKSAIQGFLIVFPSRGLQELLIKNSRNNPIREAHEQDLTRSATIPNDLHSVG